MVNLFEIIWLCCQACRLLDPTPKALNKGPELLMHIKIEKHSSMLHVKVYIFGKSISPSNSPKYYRYF